MATQDTVTQLMAALRKVARVVGGAGQVIAAVCKLDYSRPGKPDIDWDDPAAKEALVSDLVNDALAVLDALAGPGAPGRDAADADALGLLALVAGQDVEPAEGSDGTDGRWRIARKVAPGRVISTVDTEARHTRKCKSKRRDGFRGHVAAEPDTDLITDCEMTMAAGPGSTDAENGVKMACRDRFGGDSGGGSAAPARRPATPRTARLRAGRPGRPAPLVRRRIPQISSTCRRLPGRPAPRRTPPGRARVTRHSRRARETARGWRFTATPPTAAGRPAPPTGTPGTTPSSSPSRCARPWTAGSPSIYPGFLKGRP